MDPTADFTDHDLEHLASRTPTDHPVAAVLYDALARRGLTRIERLTRVIADQVATDDIFDGIDVPPEMRWPLVGSLIQEWTPTEWQAVADEALVGPPRPIEIEIIATIIANGGGR